MSDSTNTAPPTPPAPAALRSRPQSQHVENSRPPERLQTWLPGFLKFVGSVVAVAGGVGGLLMAAGASNPIPGLSAIGTSVVMGLCLFALGDIVISLRKVAINTAR